MFLNDLKAGRVGERRAAEVFESAGYTTEMAPTKATWDISISSVDGKSVHAEVKYDVWEKKTGNVAVEYYNPKSGLPSGLNITTAALWVFVLTDSSVWVCRTADLKRHHSRGPEGAAFVRDLRVCGDGNSSSTLYRRKELFDKIFFRIDDVRPEEVSSLIEVLSEND